MDTLSELIAQSGFRGLTWQNLFMFGISGLLIYLAVKKNYEPLLLIPIGFGAMLANLPAAMLSASSGFHAEPGQTVPLLQLIYSMGIKTQLLPPVIFMGVGALVMRRGGSFFDDIQGAGKTMPLTSAAMVIGGLSLIGVPGTAGFVSKWVLVQAALEMGWWPVAMLIVASSLLAVIYVWKMVETLYMAPVPEGAGKGEPPMMMLVPIWIMAAACIWFGLNTDLTLAASMTAAKGFIAGSAGMMVH